MSKPKLTGWYRGNVKPVRNGVYMLLCGFRERIGYQHWNGVRWGCWGTTIQEAKRCKGLPAATKNQNDKWRGLTEPSK